MDQWCDLTYIKNQTRGGEIEHFFVPVYAHQVGKNKPAPTKILPAPKGFTNIDETFTKVCSLYPNDYVRIYLKNEIREGYYVKYNVANGAMQLLPNYAPGKNQGTFIQVYGKNAQTIERYDISVLGDNCEWL